MSRLLALVVAACTVVAGATATTLILTGGRASAATQWVLNDTVETTASLWAFDGWRSHSGRLVDDPGAADSGRRFFDIKATGAGSWSSVGRAVRLPSVATTCRMSVRVDVTGWAESAEEPDWYSRISLEVIDPADWTYVVLNAMTLYQILADYRTVSTVAWRPAVRDVFVRVVLLGETRGGNFVQGLSVDTLRVSCNLP